MCVENEWKENLRCLDVEENGNDQTVESQHLGEDQNKDHSDEETGLLGCTADSGVSDNTDSEAGSKTAETHSQTSAEM